MFFRQAAQKIKKQEVEDWVDYTVSECLCGQHQTKEQYTNTGAHNLWCYIHNSKLIEI